MHRILPTTLLLAALGAAALPTAGADDKKDRPDDKGFVSIFDGKTLHGWHVSGKSGHSRKSQHKSGGRRRSDEQHQRDQPQAHVDLLQSRSIVLLRGRLMLDPRSAAQLWLRYSRSACGSHPSTRSTRCASLG